MNMPNGTERLSEITIDLINQYFKLTTVKNDRTVEHISNGKSIFSLDGKEFTEEEVKTFSLTAELNSCKLLYLYNLPQRTRTINSVVEKRIFWVRYRFKSQIRENRDRFLVFLF
jgi:hypothetical protein